MSENPEFEKPEPEKPGPEKPGPEKPGPDDFSWEDQVGVRPFTLRPSNPKYAMLAGYAVSQVCGFGAIAIVTLFFTHFNLRQMTDLAAWTAGILGFSQFFLVPFGMGLVGSYFWLDNKGGRGPFGLTFVNTGISCILAYFVLKEGTICLIMASGFIWMAMAVGCSVGNVFWRRNPYLSMSLVPLFLLLAWTESSFPAEHDFYASTDFHSKASPASLWRYTASYPTNTQPTQGWLFALGMPAPTSCGGNSVVGGRRDCLLTGGVSVGSHVVEAEKNRSLEFVFDQQPKHPEITHHFELQKGRIDLIPDGQGGTIIRGTSWYRLKVTPMTYFNWWSVSVVHSTHWRVFKWMDELARRHPV